MSNVTASDQVVSYINTWDYPNYLSIAPQIVQKTFPSGGDPQFNNVDGVGGNSSGGRYYTDTAQNNYGKPAGHNPKSELITFTSGSDRFDIQLVKNGRNITYSSSPNATVYAWHVLYSDVIGAVAWKIGSATQRTIPSPKPPEKVDDVYLLQEDTAPTNVVTSTTGSLSKTIPANELFSFLRNVQLYFNGPIYQLIGGNLVLTDNIRQDQLGSYGGYFCLTSDLNKPYPDGKTELEISDGFSQAKATVVFDHDTTNSMVTITINPHTFVLCELRDLGEVGWSQFPNTLCVAL
ncbi:hypothetical protein [Pseudomonas sp. LB3P14]